MKVNEIRTGGIVKSLAGRDKGRLYMIVGREGDVLLLADGKYRPAESPKRKNRSHGYLLPVFFPEIAENLAQGKNENSRIRAALKAPACAPHATGGET